MNVNLPFGGQENLTNQIINTTEIVQSFTAIEDELKIIEIAFGTYCRTNDAMILIEIIDKNGICLKSCAANSSTFLDNEYFQFKLNCKLTKDERYFLMLTSTNGTLGKSITAKWGIRRHFGEVFYINGIPKIGELCVNFIFDNKKKTPTIKAPISTNYIKGLISVVIPCYNSALTIERTLQSLNKQEYNNMEIIVVDDCSSDVMQLEKILSNYNCNFIKLTKHKGEPTARNTGGKIAKGEFIYFCDSDVILYDYTFKLLIQKLHDNINCSWAYGNFKWGNRILTFAPFNPIRMLEVNCSSTMSLIRHCDFIGFDESLKKLQDWDLFISMMKEGKLGIWEDSLLFETPFSKTGITNNSISEQEARKILKQKHPEIR